MATSGRRWSVRIIILAAVVALGAGLWYAHARGWPTQAYDWTRRHLSGKAETQAGNEMDMPGMDMGSMSKEPSGVPGHADVTLPGEVRQRIGVTVGKVEEGPLRMAVRTVGIVRADETRIARIHIKTEGWVNKVFVDYVGQKVKKGDPLLSIYSPQFLTTQQEYLNVRRGGQKELAALSLRRLELWDVPAEEIRHLEKSGEPQKYLTLRSPIEGTILSRDVFPSQYVMPKTELFAVADLSTVWVQAKVYEYELPHVELGRPATVTVPAMPGRELAGKVVFVSPTVDEATRTTQVRVELPNKKGLLKPGMFAHVVIEHPMGEGLLVPATAVIRTGERDIAYRVESEGRFVPVEVQLGQLRFGSRFQILKGLKAGERVATSANFLIDSESRLRAGGGMSMPGMEGMDMGGMKGMEGMDQKKGDMKEMGHDKKKH